MPQFIEPFPEDFPSKGKFRVWDHASNPQGYRDAPQYAGQQPIRFPEDATPFECFTGGYIREADV